MRISVTPGEAVGDRRVLPSTGRYEMHTERMWMDAERDDEEYDEEANCDDSEPGPKLIDMLNERNPL